MVCAACGWNEYKGALFCSKCTSPLFDNTKPAAEVQTKPVTAPKKTGSPLIGQRVGRDTPCAQRVTFVFPDSNKRVTLELKQRIMIGRADSAGGYCPDLDLEQHMGTQLGVSRSHAMIEVTHRGVVLTDLGSTNGTCLNNFELPAELPYALNDGDQVYFGQLLAHILFE
jgi:hypothetical protein